LRHAHSGHSRYSNPQPTLQQISSSKAKNIVADLETEQTAYDLLQDQEVDRPVEDESIDDATFMEPDIPQQATNKSDDIESDDGSEDTGSSTHTILQYMNEGECVAGRAFTIQEVQEFVLENPQEHVPKKIHPPSYENPWLPFASQHDWDLTSWFAHAQLSKGQIDKWFKTPSLQISPAQNTLKALNSHEDMLNTIYDIPYGISNGDRWLQREITVDPQVLGGRLEKHILRYRPIKQCLEFLLGHRPFASELSWAPVKKSYGTSGPRVYDEMHTGTWWWNTQSRLPPGATVVPIIIATDKTLMTQHAGDRTAWPLYIQVGNLNRRTRRKQTTPATLLVALLPTSKATTKNSDIKLNSIIKSKLYHQCMKTFFERKLYHNQYST
jgi:hypothetical protein